MKEITLFTALDFYGKPHYFIEAWDDQTGENKQREIYDLYNENQHITDIRKEMGWEHKKVKIYNFIRFV